MRVFFLAQEESRTIWRSAYSETALASAETALASAEIISAYEKTISVCC
jgi:hypothetical protein